MLRLLEWILALVCGFPTGLFLALFLVGSHIVPDTYGGWVFLALGVGFTILYYRTLIPFVREI